MSTKKLCWFCKHAYFSEADQGWSEYTPGSDASLWCDKQAHPNSWNMFDGDLDFADSCPKFVWHPSIVKNYNPEKS